MDKTHLYRFNALFLKMGIWGTYSLIFKMGHLPACKEKNTEDQLPLLG